jgi:hypothetical protein
MEVSEKTLIDIEMSINNLTMQKDQLVFEKREIEAKNSELKNKIRTTGRMPQRKYEQLCAEQDKNKRKMIGIEKEIMEIGTEISRKNNLRQSVWIELQGSTTKDVKPELIALRDKYSAYGSNKLEPLRVRNIAKMMAEELDNLILSI